MYSEESYLDDLARAFPSALHEHPQLEEAIALTAERLMNGCKVLVAGNGGSAAQSSRLVGEMVGKFVMEQRPAFPFLSLADSPAQLTAWANDVNAETAFARQVAALGNSGDVLILLTTSGRSVNLVKAAQTATGLDMYVIAFVGDHPNDLEHYTDVDVTVPAIYTPTVQDLQSILIHRFCFGLERKLCQTS